jgi:DNA-binding transcriptional regulator GbsR (MarR family)
MNICCAKSAQVIELVLMFSDTQALRAYLFKLGLASEIADIYLALHTYGPQSLSELARHSGVERTRIYRMMDELTASNLVEIETQYKKNIFHAAPITNLQILISKKEQDIRDLQKELQELHRNLSDPAASSPATRIQFYKGIEGLKQMYWNQTKGTTENLAILHENMQIRTNLSFFERWAHACNENGLKFRGIINDNFIKTQQEWYGEHSNGRLANWRSRYLPDNVFLITHSVVIYDDVTSYYNWKDGEIFGVEMRNQEIADSQRQFFEMLWSQGTSVDDLKDIESRVQ